MHGDFSRLDFSDRRNYRGLLHQQGRVLLDYDVNSLTYFDVSWQERAGRDLFGAGVAAVASAENPQAFEVTTARRVPGGAYVGVRRGELWANGSPVANDRDGEWLADYLDAPAPAPPVEGTRDAVLLETWFETVSGFQDRDLLEPALGGPDTSTRLATGTALRLARMLDGEHCDDVLRRISSEPAGRITVRLDAAATHGDEDCPVEDPGGYRGPEHHLYRIEMAHTTDGVARFKWSRCNGGLLAQGQFVAAESKVVLSANHRAVVTAGLPTSFYIEALVLDEDRRHWRVVYGGRASIANDHELDLTADVFGAMPAGERIAIRIWDGLEDVAAFPAAGAPLRDGILVAFLAPGAPGDHWMFAVRAGHRHPETLLDNERPSGIERSHVALGVITWGAGTDVPSTGGAIADCRRPFAPLTRRDACCTIRVGDGRTSHGDVSSLQAAFDRLPPEGGTICVLPGEHLGGRLIGRSNVTIHGCGPRTRVVPRPGDEAAITIGDGSLIEIRDLAVDGGSTGGGIFVGGTIKGDRCELIRIERVWARAAARSAIQVEATRLLFLRDCIVFMADSAPAPGETAWPAVTIDVRNAWIERNIIRVEVSPSLSFDRRLVRGPTAIASPDTAQVGLGGLWLRGGSRGVRISDNDIGAGAGHGIILGHAELVPIGDPLPPPGGTVRMTRFGWPFGATGPCSGCIDGAVWIPWPGENNGDNPAYFAGPPLQDITITHNRIRDMGMSGIGVAAFFESDENQSSGAIRIDDLEIAHNTIEGCLRRDLEPIPETALDRMGFGAIALAEIQDATIANNLIERSGTATASAVCGVYIWQSRNLTIRDNAITGNGRVLTAAAPGEAGARAGIWIQRAESSAPSQALVVDGNDVSSPGGPALRAMLAGAAAITNNRLASTSLAPGQEASSGTTVRCLGQKAASAPNVLLQLAAAIRGPLPPGSPPTVAIPLDTHHELRVAFASNRVHSVHTTSAEVHTAIALIGFVDIGFADNHGAVSAPPGAFATQATLCARTLRATGNRFEEPPNTVVASAVLAGSQAIAAANLADHCLVVVAGQAMAVTGNLERGGAPGDTCETLADGIRLRLKP